MAIPIKAVLTVTTSAFTRGMSLASKGVLGLGAAVAKLTLLLTGLTTAMGFLILRQTSLIDRLGKIKTTTGFSTQALQSFRLAAEQAGVSSDQADVALRRFSRRFGEAARGTGELLPALRRLGIAVRDQNGDVRDMEDVLFDFADGIKATKGESQQLSLAFKAFDSEGAELVGTLKDGSEGLRQIFEQAERFNLILDDELIKNVEVFRDALSLFTFQVTSLAQAVVAQLTPALTELLINGILKLAEAMPTVDEKFKSLQTALKGGKISVMEFFTELRDTSALRLFAVETVNSILSILSGFTTGLMKVINFIIPGINLLIETYTNMVRKMGDDPDFGFSDAAVKAKTDIAILNTELNKLQEPVFSKTGRLSFVPKDSGDAQRIDEIKSKIAELQLTVKNNMTLDLFTPGQFKEVEDFFNRYMDNFKGPPMGIVGKLLYGDKTGDQVIEEIVVIGERIEKSLGQKIMDALFGSDNVDEFWQNYGSTGIGALTKLGSIAKLVLGEQIFENLRESFAAAGVGDFTKTLTEGLTKAATMFEDALAQAFVNGKADFSDLADFIKLTLIKAFIQAKVTNPLLELFSFDGGGYTGSGPRTGGVDGKGGFLSILHPNETVVDHARGMRGGGGGGTNVNYTINATSAESFQELVARDPQFIYAVTQAGARSIPGAR